MIENHLPDPEFVPEQPKPPTRIKNPLFRLVGGLKFGLTTLALILIASTVGEFMPHDDEANPMAKGMSLRYVFHTWWYQSLLFIMGVNLVMNTIMTWWDETRVQFLPILRKHPDHYKPLKVQTKTKFAKTAINDPTELNKSLCGALHGAGYRAFYDADGVYAHRGLIARYGSSVTHLGLIIIILGALVESNFKIDGNVSLLEEETTGVYVKENEKGKEHPLGFDVTVHDFEFTEYPGTHTASKYKSTLTFQPPNGEPRHDFVRVNHDVTYNNWTFHQTSYQQIEDGKYMDRYFVSLEEKTADGAGKAGKAYQFEIYVDPSGPNVKPLPGRDDLFFGVERDPGSQSVVWTVADKEKVLARGVKNLNDLNLSLRRFVAEVSRPGDPPAPGASGADFKNPAAMIEVSSGKTIEYRQWAGRALEPAGSSESSIQFVIQDVELAPAKAAPPLGEGETAGSVEDLARVTVMLYHQGRPTGRVWTLRKGETQAMSAPPDAKLEIPGDFQIKTLTQVPAYMTRLAVSWNPGIPIVWLGAIFASFGPFLAFFVSRRRVWAHLDWAKKTLIVGGESRYSREALEDELGEVLEKWSASPEVAMEPPIKLARPTERPKLSLSL